MYTKENPPEWATHIITFDGKWGEYYTFYNKERWLYTQVEGGFDEGVWDGDEDLVYYLERPVVVKAKHEEINFQLENE